MKNEKKKIEKSNTRELKKKSSSGVFVLDDRMPRYDEKNDKIVRPGEPGYDDLPVWVL